MKKLALYSAVLLVFGLGIFFTLERGRQMTPRSAPGAALSPSVAAPAAVPDPSPAAESSRRPEPLSRLLLQLVVILTVTRLVGLLFTRIGQPAVVGEMFAGVLLGPSLFGLIFPVAFEFLFPVASLDTLKLLSQIGVCLFLFVVGLELDGQHLRDRAPTAVMVSHASIVFPFFLGVLLSLTLYGTLAGPGTSFVAFALFMGISMSITAFPVLARILQERRLEKTPLGVMAITCAAVDDVTAWSLLAFVVAIVRSTGVLATALSLGLVVVYVGVMLIGLRPWLARWWERKPRTLTDGLIAVVLLFTFSSALVTELMGIHALFGAFLAGVVMPPQAEFRQELKLRLESIGSVFLLPLFFALTGLRTQIGLLHETGYWGFCLLILLVACAGKVGGTMLPARFTGLNWLDSFSLGALMNTRGLMELVAINIGYDLGILSPPIFTMLVIMALATTFMTGPLLGLADFLRRRQQCARSVPETFSPSKF